MTRFAAFFASHTLLLPHVTRADRYFGGSAEQQFYSLKKNGPGTVSEVERIYNALQPLPSPSFMIGSWSGGSLDTGHPGHKSLSGMRWAGKDFRSVDDADPIVCYDEEGKRVYNAEWGHSSLREMVFRGVTSTAMIYDDKPIFDHFRFVDEDTVMGVMDAPKLFQYEEGSYYFYLVRRKE